MADSADTVVAIIDDPETGRKAVAALAAERFPAQLLHGEEGRASLTTVQEEGASGALKKMMRAFGDEVRIVDRLEAFLEMGASVLTVDVDSDQAAQVAVILEDHGAHDMWRLGEWSFNRIGSVGSGEG